MAHIGHHGCIIRGNCKKSKNLKISYIFEKTLFSLLFAVSVRMTMKKYIKKKNQLRY